MASAFNLNRIPTIGSQPVLATRALRYNEKGRAFYKAGQLVANDEAIPVSATELQTLLAEGKVKPGSFYLVGDEFVSGSALLMGFDGGLDLPIPPDGWVDLRDPAVYAEHTVTSGTSGAVFVHDTDHGVLMTGAGGGTWRPSISITPAAGLIARGQVLELIVRSFDDVSTHMFGLVPSTWSGDASNSKYARSEAMIYFSNSIVQRIYGTNSAGANGQNIMVSNRPDQTIDRFINDYKIILQLNPAGGLLRGEVYDAVSSDWSTEGDPKILQGPINNVGGQNHGLMIGWNNHNHTESTGQMKSIVGYRVSDA